MRCLVFYSLLVLTGCNSFARFTTSITGSLSYICAKTGILYAQSDSGLAVLRDKTGAVVACEGK
jgi:hypothetical protein